MPAAAGVVDEKGSEYILARTGPRELDGHPLGGVWVGVWFSSRLYYPFSKGPVQHIIRCLKNKKCENERHTLTSSFCFAAVSMCSRTLMKMMLSCGDVIPPFATPVLKVIVALVSLFRAGLTVAPS